MLSYKKLNNITGWAAFVIAMTVYTITIEPTASFWDCGEFIACAYKLQVPHPPGSPLFMLIGRLFSMHIPIDGTTEQLEQVAFWVNMVSAVSSAFTILFLFWSITLIGRKLMGVQTGEEPALPIKLALLGSGLIGALAYTFTESFWFSAVEAEVYALSSFFTAFVFWAMLKWEAVEDEREGDRWLLLIALMIGLSTGVHLLNLVAIPALGFIYYFKKFKPDWKGAVATFFISGFILFFVLIIVIQKIPEWAGDTEVFFVNSLGMGFNSGIIFFFLLLLALVVGGIVYSIKIQHRILNLAMLGLTFVLIGYSTYGIIIIRSNFDPVIDENNPENFVKLVSYLKREQYGQRPLLSGPQFTAPNGGIERYNQGAPKYKKQGNRYVKYDYKVEPEYAESSKKAFPRMHSTRDDHVRAYENWLNKNYPGWDSPTRDITGWQNLNYFFERQIGHMYMRYFYWNFVGRDGEDNQRAGAAWFGDHNSELPETLQSDARNHYYALPLLLGIIGIFFHLLRDRKSFSVTALLFFFTGIAILIYLNNPAFEPRERDYTYVGSFYVFAIWIGLGMLAIFNGLRTGIMFPARTLTQNDIKFVKVDPKLGAVVAFALCMAVPGILVSENWNDHDRSNRYFSVDQAKNLLNMCAKNAIIFTGGDNDTFPLWYVQEVEGFRTDVRVCNLSLLNTDWYVEQMKRKAYLSDPLPISLEEDDYIEGSNDIIDLQGLVSGGRLIEYRRLPQEERQNYKDKGVMEVSSFIKSLKQNDPRVRQREMNDDVLKYKSFYPTRELKISFDKEEVIKKQKSKLEDPNDRPALPEALFGAVGNELRWNIKKTLLYKKDLVMLDMIANIAANGWDRPIYFSTGISRDNYLNLQDYMMLEGFAYRLVPAKVQESPNIDVMYDNLMNQFAFRELDNENIYYTEDYTRQVTQYRSTYMQLSAMLMDRKDSTRAKEVLEFSMTKMPDAVFPYEMDQIGYVTAQLYMSLNETDKGLAFVDKLINRAKDELSYFRSKRGTLPEAQYEIQERSKWINALADLLDRSNQKEKASELRALVGVQAAPQVLPQ